MDDNSSKRLIIERFCYLGNINEIKLFFSTYGKKDVINEFCYLNYIDNKTLA